MSVETTSRQPQANGRVCPELCGVYPVFEHRRYEEEGKWDSSRTVPAYLLQVNKTTFPFCVVSTIDPIVEEESPIKVDEEDTPGLLSVSGFEWTQFFRQGVSEGKTARCTVFQASRTHSILLRNCMFICARNILTTTDTPPPLFGLLLCPCIAFRQCYENRLHHDIL